MKEWILSVTGTILFAVFTRRLTSHLPFAESLFYSIVGNVAVFLIAVAAASFRAKWNQSDDGKPPFSDEAGPKGNS